MFVMKTAVSYRWPVEVSLPVDGGQFQKSTFDVTFRRLGASRVKEIQDGIMSETISDDRTLAREIVEGWQGVNDEHGQPLPFSEQSFTELLEITGTAAAIIKAWYASLNGAPRKN